MVPVDEIELGKRQAKGARAQDLLNNDLLREVFSYLETEYLTAWRNTRVSETGAREKLWQAVHIVNLVRDHLTKFVTDGRIATRDLASIKYLKR
jgi:hypothetical protein